MKPASKPQEPKKPLAKQLEELNFRRDVLAREVITKKLEYEKARSELKLAEHDRDVIFYKIRAGEK